MHVLSTQPLHNMLLQPDKPGLSSTPFLLPTPYLDGPALPSKGSVTHLITCSETITLLLQIISFNFFLVDISRETTTISSLPFSHFLSYDMNPKFCCLLIWIKTLVLIIPQASVLLLHKFNTHPAVYTNPIKDWKGTSNFLPPCRYFWRMAFITNM